MLSRWAMIAWVTVLGLMLWAAASSRVRVAVADTGTVAVAQLDAPDSDAPDRLVLPAAPVITRAPAQMLELRAVPLSSREALADIFRPPTR